MELLDERREPVCRLDSLPPGVLAFFFGEQIQVYVTGADYMTARAVLERCCVGLCGAFGVLRYRTIAGIIGAGNGQSE